MLFNKIDIFEFNSNLGLRVPGKKEPQVKFFPNHLKKYGFYDEINPRKTFNLEPQTYQLEFDKDTGILNADEVILYTNKQAELLEKELDTDTFKLILGGDCSILLGSSIALKKRGTYGLFYLDGHTDYSSIETTDTKAIAGMDLALATGFGPNKLVNIDGLSPYFNEENVFCVGDKESDPEYVKLIKNSKINYYDLFDLKKIGGQEIAKTFLDHVYESDLDGFFVHFDVDVLSSDFMPSVDCPDTRGINYEELTVILKELLSSQKIIGMEITIFDPSLDTDGVIVKKFIEEITYLFKDYQTINTDII